MPNLSQKTTYQYIVDLEDEKLATAQTMEEQLTILNHFRTMRDAIYQRELESFLTAHQTDLFAGCGGLTGLTTRCG